MTATRDKWHSRPSTPSAAALGPERFLAEIRTGANLQHPHILPLHDSGEAALVAKVMTERLMSPRTVRDTVPPSMKWQSCVGEASRRSLRGSKGVSPTTADHIEVEIRPDFRDLERRVL